MGDLRKHPEKLPGVAMLGSFPTSTITTTGTGDFTTSFPTFATYTNAATIT